LKSAPQALLTSAYLARKSLCCIGVLGLESFH
jgi:hypothetical protein